MGESLDRLLASAKEAESNGDYLGAESLANQALQIHPASRRALLLRAVAVSKQRRIQEGLQLLGQYLSIDPNSLTALNLTGRLLREVGHVTAAIAYSERSIQVDPADPEPYYNLGLCYFALNRFDHSIHYLERSTKLVEGYAAGFYALACVYESIGQPWQALMAIRANVAIDPYPEGFLKLGQLSLAVGDVEGAVEFGKRALEKVSTAPAAHALLADAYADLVPSESQAHYESAIKFNPAFKETIANGRAKRLTRLGRVEEALVINGELVEDDPDSGAAYLNYVTIKKIGVEDRPLVAKMETLSAEPGLPVQEKIYLHFALGKAFDNLGNYEQAMKHYVIANDLSLESRPDLRNFDPKGFARRVDSLIGLFTKEFVQRNKDVEQTSNRPIFIVGMMRSGTTLAEQILSSHSEVAAGGELAHWTYGESKIVDFSGKKIQRAILRETSESYLDILRTIDPKSQFVTDKNPANCFSVGLIALAFPNAHIVHMVREPIETGLSIFITPTRNPPEFGCDRGNIVFAMQQTERLMKHWESVLPTDRFHVVRYEDLVREQEVTTRKLISDCGLEWQDRCLHPEANRSLVGTPSVWQVRQPVNINSTGRSKRYAPWLGALEKLL
jgi:tetratricopeptide (TPR) repeat protein